MTVGSSGAPPCGIAFLIHRVRDSRLPVMKLILAGTQRGVVVQGFANRVPLWARESMLGVCIAGFPMQPTASQRC